MMATGEGRRRYDDMSLAAAAAESGLLSRACGHAPAKLSLVCSSARNYIHVSSDLAVKSASIDEPSVLPSSHPSLPKCRRPRVEKPLNSALYARSVVRRLRLLCIRVTTAAVFGLPTVRPFIRTLSQ